MRLATLSDTHGHLPATIPACDVLIHAGDVCPATDHSYKFQLNWLDNTFRAWVKEMFEHTKHIVLVAGNHDWIWNVSRDAATFIEDMGVTYLQGSGTSIAGVKFYGYPYCPEFCGWAFMGGPEAMKRHAAQIPDGTDVLITHGPPIQILDVPGFKPAEHCGCKYLRHRLYSVRPKLHVFGHIHGSFSRTKIDGTTYVNASYVDESYSPRGPESIQVIEL